jgi:hypothetical protein
MSTRTEEEVVRCSACDRAVEVCGFCGERCGTEVCYRCCLEELGETVPHPHKHGG